jgi:hypothetical protein
MAPPHSLVALAAADGFLLVRVLTASVTVT